MNLNQLKIFYLAVKHGNLSTAGKKLNITQPAVTKGIQRLQEFYDIQLLNRFGKRLVLTDAGEALFMLGFALVLVYMVTNLLVDVLYAVLDPRIRYD